MAVRDREAADLHPQLVRKTDVLLPDVDLVQMRRDAYHLRAEFVRSLGSSRVPIPGRSRTVSFARFRTERALRINASWLTGDIPY